MEKEKQQNGAASEKKFFGPYDFLAKLPLDRRFRWAFSTCWQCLWAT